MLFRHFAGGFDVAWRGHAPPKTRAFLLMNRRFGTLGLRVARRPQVDASEACEGQPEVSARVLGDGVARPSAFRRGDPTRQTLPRHPIEPETADGEDPRPTDRSTRSGTTSTVLIVRKPSMKRRTPRRTPQRKRRRSSELRRGSQGRQRAIVASRASASWSARTALDSARSRQLPMTTVGGSSKLRFRHKPSFLDSSIHVLDGQVAQLPTGFA